MGTSPACAGFMGLNIAAYVQLARGFKYRTPPAPAKDGRLETSEPDRLLALTARSDDGVQEKL
jgi:hypothetical protein